MNKNISVARWFKLIFPAILVITLICGCDDKFDTIQPPGISPPKAGKVESSSFQINTEKTNAFFKLKTESKLGDKVGTVELRSEGILIHPGEIKSSVVSFKISGKFSKLSVKSFISPLPIEALKIKEAGTVGVEYLLDGKSGGRFTVNRYLSPIKELNLTNVDVLTVVVDNGDGKAWFDWLMLGVVDSK